MAQHCTLLLSYHICQMGYIIPESKVHVANMGPTWDLSAPDGPHVGPMNLAIGDLTTIAVAIILVTYHAIQSL